MPVRSRSVVLQQQQQQAAVDFGENQRIAGQMQNVTKCYACDMPIFDRYIMTVLDRTWHADCLRCCQCKCPLQDKCLIRGDRLFCREDFYRVFGIKCNGCGVGIDPSDLVRRTPRGDVYHLKCFICTTCRKQLSTGEELHIIGDCEFKCKDDYVISKHAAATLHHGQPLTVKTETLSPAAASPCFTSRDLMHDPAKSDQQRDCLSITGASEVTNGGGPNLIIDHNGLAGADDEDVDEDEDMKRSESGSHNAPTDRDCCDKDTKSVGDGSSSIDESEPRNDENVSTKRRGPRTTIKAKQLELLKNAFAQTPKPTRHIRDQLSQETGLTMRVIQVWFQNRRSKERRMKQQNLMGPGRRCNMFRSRRSGGRSLREFDGDSGDILSGVQGPPGFAYFPDGPGNHGMEFFPGQVSPGVHPQHPHAGLGHPPGIFDFAHYRQPQNAAEAMAHFNELPPNAHGMPGNINHNVDGHFRQELLSQASTPNSLTPDGYGHPAFDTLHAANAAGMNGNESPVWQSMTMAQ